VHILPKWYIMVLANKICCMPVLDVMVTFKTEKVLEMSTDQRKKDIDSIHFTFEIFKKLLDQMLGSISNMENLNEILVWGRPILYRLIYQNASILIKER
jgi:hypothetical protein